MNTHRMLPNCLIPLLLLLSAFPLTAAPPPSPVTVVNAPQVTVNNDQSNPVPVTVQNVPGVQSVDGTVEVVNFPRREPVNLFVQVPRTSPGQGGAHLYTVPEGKRLVIEYVTMQTVGDSFADGEGYIGFLSYFNQQHLIGTLRGEEDFFNFGPDTGTVVRLHVGPGTAIGAHFVSTADTVPSFVNFYATGYLEDLL